MPVASKLAINRLPIAIQSAVSIQVVLDGKETTLNLILRVWISSAPMEEDMNKY